MNEPLYDRQFYENNPFIRYLNFRQPEVFKLVWNAYLTYRRLRLPKSYEQIPNHPVTPIVQLQKWPRPVPGTHETGGPKILIVTFTGWSFHTLMDGLIGRALMLRGARVRYFSCGGILPLCYIHNASTSDGIGHMPCGRCRAYVTSTLNAFGFEAEQLRHLVTDTERRRIEAEVRAIQEDNLTTYTYEGVKMGYAAFRTARWYLLAGTTTAMPELPDVVRNLIFLARMTYAALSKILEQEKFDRIVIFGGLQTAELVIREIAEQRKIDVVCTERGYVANSFMAAHNAPVSLFPFDELWEVFKERHLTESQSKQLDEILSLRRYGHKTLDNLWEQTQEDVNVLRQDLMLEPGKRIVTAFTNVVGDVAVIDREIGFESLLHWCASLIEYFKNHPDIYLIFRIHPAETRLKRYKPRQSVGELIMSNYPQLPDNIKIVPSESPLSSYALLEISDFVMVYTSTIGLESAAAGWPVAVGARVHYQGKGFTLDASSPQRLTQLMDSWIADPESYWNINTELARRYAYLMLYRAPMPLDEIMDEMGGFGRIRLKVQGWEDLQPGRIKVIDAICSAILEGKPFLNPYIEDNAVEAT
jgi:hypothetical protein